MKAKNAFVLAMAAGCACSAGAGDKVLVDASDRVHAAEIRGHVFYNVNTGETILTPTVLSVRNASDLVWNATDSDQGCGFNFFFGSSDNDQTSTDPIQWSFPDDRSDDWGDVACDTLVDCITWAYATNQVDPAGSGVPGFDSLITLWDSDNGFGDTNRVPLVAFNFTNAPGDPTGTGFSGWLLTFNFDVAGGGTAAAELGDTDSDAGGNTDPNAQPFFNPMSCDDTDTFAGHEFGYDYQFIVPDPNHAPGVGIAGPFIVLPDPNLGVGGEEGFDTYGAGGTTADYVATFWFGGYSCALGQPFSQWYIELYAAGGASPCIPDVAPPNPTLDFFDVLAFLGLFDAMDPFACGLSAPATVCDFFDVLAYLGLFDAGCP